MQFEKILQSVILQHCYFCLLIFLNLFSILNHDTTKRLWLKTAGAQRAIDTKREHMGQRSVQYSPEAFQQ